MKGLRQKVIGEEAVSRRGCGHWTGFGQEYVTGAQLRLMRRGRKGTLSSLVRRRFLPILRNLYERFTAGIGTGVLRQANIVACLRQGILSKLSSLPPRW